MKTSIALAGVVAAIQLLAGAALAESPEAARAREQLEPYRQLPTFQAPGKAFDAAACMKDKSILTIPASSANHGANLVAEKHLFEFARAPLDRTCEVQVLLKD